MTRTELADPYEGASQWWSGTGDFMDNTLTRTVDLPPGEAALSARVWYDTEQDFDFLTVEASTDGGRTFSPLPGTVNGTPIPPKGVSGTSSGWSELSVPLTPLSGRTVQLRFRATSDGNTHGRGVAFDDIRITADGGRELLRDGAEQGANGWTALKWSRTEGRTGSEQHPRAYFVENRRYTGYGALLKTGPYNFGFTGDKVEFYPYQQGVLVWLWDTAYSDNTTKAHPGAGLLLPVDSPPGAPRLRGRHPAQRPRPDLRRPVLDPSDGPRHPSQGGRPAGDPVASGHRGLRRPPRLVLEPATAPTGRQGPRHGHPPPDPQGIGHPGHRPADARQLTPSP